MLQQLVNGLILGSVYALLALGYTMVYGIIKLINFAHGDIYMMGAFMGYFLVGSGPALGCVCSVTVCSFMVDGVGAGERSASVRARPGPGDSGCRRGRTAARRAYPAPAGRRTRSLR